MRTLTQKLRSGKPTIERLPLPIVAKGTVLVRNHFSVISAGTEGSTVSAARKSVLGKVKERPQQAKQLVEVVKTQGPVQAYRAAMKKLEAYSPLGYSCAGEVIEIGADVNTFSIGDKVACGGLTANHAEVVCVPVNLCVKLPEDAELKEASYNTLGAIALQGVRQADLRLGESCVVIGLGLLGQLTCLLLRASGVRVIGIDLDSVAVELAREHAAIEAWTRDTPGLVDLVTDRTDGLGADATIISAATSSTDPINLAGAITRKKGRVVVVGDVPTGFDRDPYYYRKELELRMSCSYGPGRYDPTYEEKGIDYPPAYVRWTEKRNMQAFQELVHSGRVNLGYLTTHEFTLEEAPKAYDMIVNRSEPFLGVVIKYAVEKPIEREAIIVRPSRPAGKVGIGFIGAGSYAQGSLLPNLPNGDPDIVCRGVVTNSGTTSKRVAERFGFEFCTDRVEDLLESQAINTVFIATRHDSHAEFVLQALRAGKHVFVEKPLCLTTQQLEEIETAYRDRCGERDVAQTQLMLGFNRRFAPLAIELKSRLNDSPVSMIYRVNAGAIPSDSWIQDPELGGGRIVGEVCHFVDFLTWLCGSVPNSVHAAALPDPHGLNDTVSVNLSFANGSTGAVCYFANGSKKVPKEHVEVHQSGQTAILTDFRRLERFGDGKPVRKRSLVQDKGQANMVREFLQRLKEGGEPLILPKELFAVTRATFAIQESLSTRQVTSV